jgi:hypothetical protein
LISSFSIEKCVFFLIFQGFIVFFPYLIGARWREGRPNSLLTGRKLTSLVDMFVEEKRRGHVISPEYLSKSPCGFEVTELVLKQILVCCAETKRQLLGKDIFLKYSKGQVP